MTFEKRPFWRRLARTVGRLIARGLVLAAVAFFSVMPAWVAARAITAACSDRAPETAPSGVFDEEEEAPEAALHRHHIEIRRAAPRRSDRVATGETAVRHRAERDMQRAARRWEKYQAPPRAPPHRLLN